MDGGQPSGIGNLEDSLGKVGCKTGAPVLVCEKREGFGFTVQPICKISSEIGMAYLRTGCWETVSQAGLLALG